MCETSKCLLQGVYHFTEMSKLLSQNPVWCSLRWNTFQSFIISIQNTWHEQSFTEHLFKMPIRQIFLTCNTDKKILPSKCKSDFSSPKSPLLEENFSAQKALFFARTGPLQVAKHLIHNQLSFQFDQVDVMVFFTRFTCFNGLTTFSNSPVLYKYYQFQGSIVSHLCKSSFAREHECQSGFNSLDVLFVQQCIQFRVGDLRPHFVLKSGSKEKTHKYGKVWRFETKCKASQASLQFYNSFNALNSKFEIFRKILQ